MTLVSRIVSRGFRLYWRITRGLDLWAEACLLDTERRVGLVATEGSASWSLPLTRVRNGEALGDALLRMLTEDLRIGIGIDAEPELFWIQAGRPSPDGQTGLFIVRHWRANGPAREAKLAFFSLDGLPSGLPSAEAARIRQAVDGRAPFEVC